MYGENKEFENMRGLIILNRFTWIWRRMRETEQECITEKAFYNYVW